MYKGFKYMVDILLSLISLPIMLVLFVVFAVFILVEDKGPVFYKSARIGRNSNKFYMIKFRSMKVNAPDIRNEDGSTFNSKDDPRVTRIGKFLRETSLDEVPQILNVLKGDMSIVGPRAGIWDDLNTYKADETDKMKVRPGITGYTQAYYRNGLSVREKRIKDAWYANNVSIWLDVKIFFKTIVTVLKKENLYTNNGSSVPLQVEKEISSLIDESNTI